MNSSWTAEIRQLVLAVPEPELRALYARLRDYRDAGEYGAAAGLVPAEFVGELLTYWTERYDWRAREARLGQYEHFATHIGGQFVHFLRIRADRPTGSPVLLTHEWPSGLLDVLDAAATWEAARSSDLVVPSISWSALVGPGEPGQFGGHRTAAGWAELMERLGYENYRVGDDRTGIDVVPAYTRLGRSVGGAGAEPGQRLRGLSTVELGEVRWFHENLAAPSGRRQLSALVLSTVLLAWQARALTGPADPADPADPDAILTDVMLAWFITRLAARPAEKSLPE